MTAIRGGKRPVLIGAALAPPQKLNTQLNCDIHNRFDIEVVDAATGEVKQRAQAQNVICNQLWTRLLAPNTYFNYIHYGTGTGTPAATDTSLFTFLGYGTPATANDVFSMNGQTGVASFARKIQLSETTAVGSTLTEVGIGYGTTASTLVTHAMLKDMNGDQISIAKTATDIINIYATVFLHWTASGFDGGSIKIVPCGNMNKNAYAYIFGISATYIPQYIVATHGGEFYNFYMVQNRITHSLSPTYSSQNKSITIGPTRFGTNEGNFNGITTFMVSAAYDYRPFVQLHAGGSWYPGTSITGETIGTGDGTTMDFSTDFAIVQAGATIYIDSIAQTSNVYLDVDTPAETTAMGMFFEQIDGDEVIPPEIISGNGFGFKTSGTFYNPYYSLGIASFYTDSDSIKWEVSDDLSAWVTITNSPGTHSVPSEYQHYKYWRVTNTDTTNSCDMCGTNFTIPNAKTTNIHFTTPPAAGAVITAGYTTKTIAKDANHVFDLTVTIQLGEPTM